MTGAPILFLTVTAHCRHKNSFSMSGGLAMVQARVCSWETGTSTTVGPERCGTGTGTGMDISLVLVLLWAQQEHWYQFW